MRHVPGFLVSLTLTVILSAGQSHPPAFGAAPAGRSFPPPVLRTLRSASAPAATATLPRVSDADVAAVRRWNDGGNLPARAGVVRPLPNAIAVQRRGVASMDATPWRWRGRVDVSGATHLRLQLTDVAAPADAIFWVYSDDGAAQPFDATLAHGGTIWTPSVRGPAAFVEVQAPAGAEVSFRIAAVAQMFEPGPNGSECLQDARCRSSAAKYATAIGFINYIRNGQPFMCSGGLMHDRAATFTPYFLTANQCVSNAAEAASLEVYWDYDTSACGGAAPPLAERPRSVGSTLLVTSAASDVTLLRLTGVPPGNRWYMGWDSSPVAEGTRLRRVSHPHGRPHSYSESIVTNASAACAGRPRPNYLYSVNALGSTADGSTGAPVFEGDGYVVGQLSGACGADAENPCSPTAERVDGSLAASWPLLAPYLNQATPPPCTPGPTTACLLGNRFRVTVAYRNQFATPAQTGDFAAQRLDPSATNPDTAIFGFGNAQNVEVVVRIVDARPFAPRYDLYYGGLTDVEYWVNVTDTVTNTNRLYRNPPGTVGGGVDRATFPAQ